MDTSGLIVRAASPDDAPALAALYGWHVRHGVGTFEEVPPDPAEMAARVARIQAARLPYLVAEVAGTLAAFASAAPYKDRSGYRFTAEDSVYVADGHQGRGLGRTLLSAVIERCRERGVRQLIAAIGDSENAASIGLHHALGFHTAGVLRRVGFKHDRWLDVVFMQRELGS